MTFEKLKKARWELRVSPEHRDETGAYYHSGYSFEAELDGKKFEVIYIGQLTYPLTWYFGEEVEGATEQEVVEWVKHHHTPDGYESLYERIFCTDLLKNF